MLTFLEDAIEVDLSLAPRSALCAGIDGLRVAPDRTGEPSCWVVVATSGVAMPPFWTGAFGVIGDDIDGDGSIFCCGFGVSNGSGAVIRAGNGY